MSSDEEKSCKSGDRRCFLETTAGVMGAVAVGAAAWPLIDSMNPSADVDASVIDVDISKIKAGEGVTVLWRKKTVFIRRRTKAEIKKARDGDNEGLRDRQKDEERVKNPEWLVVVGVCTHLGCIPTGHKAGQLKGDYDGWFCPCHGAHYDLSGRIRKGPAPKNLKVPKYEFTSDTTIRIG